MPTRIRVGQINFNADFDINNHKITNVATPTAGSDVATKSYVDSVATGLKWKNSVKVATTGNITLSGSQSIDGVTVSAGDRVLVWQQTNAVENGIYVASATAWARAEDADTGDELVSAACFVEQGTLYGDKGFVCTNDSITIGTTSITFVVFTTTGGLVAGNGIDITGNTISVKPSTTGGIQVDANGVAIKVKSGGGLGTDADGAYITPSFVKGAVKEDFYVQTFFGDGTTKDFTVTNTMYYGGASNNNIIVTLNGVVQKQGDDYTVDTVNNQIDFTTAPALDDIILVYYIKA